MTLAATAMAGLNPPPGEDDLSTACPTCGTSQTLAEANPVTAEDGLETVYRCRNDCGPILIVSTPGVVSWEGRGFRIGEWMLRNPSDLFMRVRGARDPVLMPASPHALD